MKVTEIFTRNLKAAASNKRFIINQGGTSSSKTYSILQTIILICLKRDNLIVSIVAETYPHMKRGVIRDFYHILMTEGLYTAAAHNKTDNTYHIGTNTIEFFPGNKVESMKGARRDILFVNEAYGVEWDVFDQLEVRTKWLVFIDYNPVSEFWVHEHLLNSVDNSVSYIHSTFRNNPFLSTRIIASINRHKDSPYWWEVYGEGNVGRLEGAIFKNWSYGEFDKYLPYSFGLDFGFNDPDAMVKVAFDHKRKIMYWDECIYKEGNSPDALKIMVGTHCSRNDAITADCADARMIDALAKHFNIKPVNKAKWTVSQALKLMQDYKHIITEDSTNLAREFKNYLWSDRRAGVPIDDFNHCFTGETMITTHKGGVQIKDIKKGDYVETGCGLQKVLKIHDNGQKQVNKYTIQLGTFSLYLRCTSDHLIKTTQGWKPISKLKSGMTIFLNKNLTERFTDFTPAKDISHVDRKECTSSYGNTLTGKFRKVIAFITRTEIHGITELEILKQNKKTSTSQNTGNSDLKKTKHGLIDFIQQVLTKQKNGTDQQMVSSGTQNTELKHGKTENTKAISAKIAVTNFNQGIQGSSNSVAITVRQVHCVSEGRRQVYDLSIDNEHEYFANGILVHNCIDAGRYRFMETISGSYKATVWHTA